MWAQLSSIHIESDSLFVLLQLAPWDVNNFFTIKHRTRFTTVSYPPTAANALFNLGLSRAPLYAVPHLLELEGTRCSRRQ